ncbi:glutathione peroxidase [Clostridium tertium]|jgi:glutathione peroxidase|uniref:Glutathione peroxidase n=3 Tax=Clostridium TaxID=1485 RepID=A0A9X3XHV6_9CLOT|nr:MULTISPECIES: glutathione peroxidase [Clostridium]MBS5307021.1 glutathione peroxidase [Clostridium sp.]MBU6135391.1 glutathione peroxidase [Clostridium tertium]MDB1922055.1 glutathione peroxidase [Clostridium tertium]MDB1927729.1 glutathione peroxidase [Clostridium tertium]MDB1929733.1 glutathione peroxidase [Clostridium tertium]
MSFYEYSAKNIDGKEINMSDYKGNIILVVNTASKCGFTPQLKDLEELYKEYKDSGVEILGFPCNQFLNQEPGENKEVKNFCQINYGVTFNMFEKIDVNGSNTHPIYKYLKEQEKGLLTKDIKWNFTKFLIDKEGNVIKRYSPATSPLKIKTDIEKLL